MTASTMLGNSGDHGLIEAKCTSVGQEVVKLWKLHLEKELQDEIEAALADCLTHCLKRWQKAHEAQIQDCFCRNWWRGAVR